MMSFKKATKAQARLRLALIGPSGSGKTYSALEIARHLGERVAVIDSEHGSASKYADVFCFDVLELENFDPRLYIEALHTAEQAQYDVVVVDGLSHAWMGRGGLLELVDRFTKRSKSKNAFTEGWREASPLQNQLVDALLKCKAHLIVTLRAKQEYVLETDPKTGRTAPRKVGLAPVQREGMEYEFDVVGTLDEEHTLVITKTRCQALDGQVIPKPGEALAETLNTWLTDGVSEDSTDRSAAQPNVKPGERLKLELRALEEKNRKRPVDATQRVNGQRVLTSRLAQLLPSEERQREALQVLYPSSAGKVEQLLGSQLLAFVEWMGALKEAATNQWVWPANEMERCRVALEDLLTEEKE